MAHTRPAQQQPLIPTARPGATSHRSQHPLQKSELWVELTRQQAQLLVRANASLATDGEPELCADPADQASTESEQDLAMQVRSRTFEKLRRIERALQLMRTCGYGQCRRCHDDIPYERLKVQPDTLYCVSCLTAVEQEAAGN